MSFVECALGDIADLVRGITFPTSAKSRKCGKNRIPCLRTTNVQNVVEWDDLIYVPESYVRSDSQLVRPGDILVSMSNSLDLVGKCALVTDVPQMATFGAFIAVVRPKEGINSEYVFHVMRSPSFRAHVRRVASTTTNISNINASKLLAAPVFVATERVRKAIVSKTGELFSRISEGERALEQVQKLVERYRQSVLKAAVTGELTREWREENKSKLESGEALLARILKARREVWEQAELEKMRAKGVKPKNDDWKKKYKEPVAPDTSDLPKLPDGWVWASLDQLTSKITSGSRDWKAYYGRGEGVFVMAQNVRPRKFDLTDIQHVDPPSDDRDALRSEIRLHDLLITIVGAKTGDVCRVPEAVEKHYVCQSVALARPVISEVSIFLELFLCADEGGQVQFAKCIYGAGRPHLSFDQLRATAIPLPPLTEQQAAIDALELIESEIAAMEAGTGASAASSVVLRQAVLKSAFSGELVPQDPSDKPASVPLERIAAEPEKAITTKPKRKPRKKAVTRARARAAGGRNYSP